MKYADDYPEHDRTSCSDEILYNVDPDGSGCRRCNALALDEWRKLRKLFAALNEANKYEDNGEYVVAVSALISGFSISS